ncbi:S41 family peptidase [Flammeovirgaceae bacterium SG7u.111]|nr:S41 family peptidase [Flammeovirgaceae bacterium SG7u.132]WPO36324.1 S41 family peptidase [Flammeovirgaceae bacterium SG7u.111]
MGKLKSRKFKFAILIIVSVASLFAFRPSDKYFEIAKNLDIFTTLFKEVNRYYVDEIDPTDLVNTGIASMLGTLDPYTNYIPEDQIDDYRTMTTGEYGGIGAIIGRKGDKIKIIMPNEGFAADKAGIKIGDELLEVDGINVSEFSINEISKLLKGQAGSEINLKIKRPDEISAFDLTLKRENIQLKNVPYYGMVQENIGLIKLTDFTQNASKEVKSALLDLKKQGATSIVLDLRGNPGGLLSEAINISNLFLPKSSEIVSTRGKIKDWNKVHRALNNPTDTEIPLAVLIDRSSASASEIVAGVIQDYDRGVLIGKRSFGKGLVQATRSLSYNAKLKVTVAKYHIPSGRCIQEIDYSHRNENGQADKVPDSLRVAFKTKGGRIVFDGGGIDPDLSTEYESVAPITRTLINKGLIFDYATDFYYNHPSIPDAKAFSLTDSQYQEFAKWLSDKEYDYTTKVEYLLNEFVANAKSEKYYDDIQAQITDLETKISHNKDSDLFKFKDEIKKFIEIEIATRYYLQRGAIEATFDYDKDIQTAVALLGDSDNYSTVLSPGTFKD